MNPGDRVDRYEVLERLGRGGMSDVYRARDDQGTVVVLKFPHPDLAGDPSAFERMRREITIGERLTHPGIQKLYGLQTDRQDPYLVLEYLEGRTLREELRDQGSLPDRAVEYGCQLAAALEYAHSQQVFHRDLKPENIIVTPHGAKVMDFGIAYIEGARRITWGRLSSEVGTPDYMAPEQIKGNRGDARTDVYALGMILYECLAGRLPYQGDNAMAIMNQHVTVSPPPPSRFVSAAPALEEVVMKAIRRKPEHRWPSMAALLSDLQRLDQVDAAGLRLEREAQEHDEVVGDFGLSVGKVALLTMAVMGTMALVVLLLQWVHGH
ncbi:MAG TPA: serine/threonine-protein kinase [Candidatus Xenobia bacterium]|jgi:serine/threonine-protein kinase